jgi:thiol:disulfide interchange protein
VSVSVAEDVSKIDWQDYSLSAFKKEASVNKYTMIDFWAEWCPSCKIYDKEVFSDTEVTRLLTEYVQTWRSDLTDFDSIRNSRIRRKYDIEALPVILFISPQGEVHRLETLVTKDEFLSILKTIQENSGKEI